MRYCDLYCATVICVEQRMSFVEFLWGTVHFSRRRYDIKNLMQKYHILPNLTVQSHKLKKLQRDDHFNMRNKSWNYRISLNYPSRVIHFQIRISWNKSEENKAALFCFYVFLDSTSSKIEKCGKLFRKRCQNFTSRVLWRWLSEDITYSGLLINKKQKATGTKKSQFLRKWNGRILEFCFYVKTNMVLQI